MSQLRPVFAFLPLLMTALPASSEASETCLTVRRGAPGEVEDAFIESHHALTNHGDDRLLRVGRAGPGQAQALLRFDLGAIPQDIVIDSATVTLFQQSNNGQATVSAHRITAPWDEDTVTWSSFAGAFDAAVEDSFDNGGAPGAGPVSLDLTALTQAWLDGAIPNHGVLLEQSPATHTLLCSSEQEKEARRPRLTVCYTCPGAEHEWSRSFGDGSEQIGYSVVGDSEGNVILAGSAAGTVDFGAGPVPPPPGSSSTAFAAKFDTSGNLLWARRFASNSSYASAVAVDADDNILLTGGFNYYIDLGGGPIYNPSSGIQNTFVAKLEPDGDHLWSRAAAGDEYHFPRGIAADGSGNVIVSGSFESYLDFGGAPIFAAGGMFDEDVFVSKLAPDGTHLWSKGFGSADIDRGQGLAVDSGDNILLAGFFVDIAAGSIDFGGGPLPSAGSSDAFVAKLDPDGDHVWSRSYGDPDSQDAAGVAVDPADNVIATGAFFGEVDFGGGPLVSAGDNDVFLLKLDAAGDHLWSRRFGDGLRQDGKSVAVDALGDIAVTGFFRGSIRFLCAPLLGAGAEDIFVAKLDAAGNPLWSDRFGDAASQFPTQVAFDAAGDVLLTGYFDGVVDFGGGPLAGQGGRDAFLAKFDQGWM